MLGSGLYGSVVVTELAAKTYYPTSTSIARDAIRESSILRHLNDSGVKSAPALHSVTNEYGNNGMITDEHQVFIIDFGVSTFGDANNVREWEVGLDPVMDMADDNHVGTFYDLSIGYKTHNTPDFHAHLRTFYSTDYWSIAAWIVNACSGKSNYIPIIHEGRDWTRIVNLLEDSSYTRRDPNHGVIDSDIILPDTITPSLVDKLRPMLRITSRKSYSIARPLNSSRLGLSKDNYDVASRTIKEIMNVFDSNMDDVPQRIGTTLDLLR